MKNARIPNPDVRTRVAFGKRVRVLRVLRDLTQDDLAKKTGTSKAAISRIEVGDVAVRIDTIFKLARALRVQTYQLFEKEEFFDET